MVSKVPHGHWKTTTFVAGLRTNALTAPCVIDGPMNGDAFLAYVEQILVPTLKPADIVVMDNLSSHKLPAIREAIEAAGARLLYLPPYSPDFNPIEQLSPNSKLRCERPQSAQCRASGTELPFCSISFHQTNAPTTSRIPAMLRTKVENALV